MKENKKDRNKCTTDDMNE